MNWVDLFWWNEIYEFLFEHKWISNIIEDRWSKYTVSWGRVTSKDDMKAWLKKHLAHKYFQKATHNTYAFRFMTDNGILVEWKNDDGETGAGQCILREMQRENVINWVIVVTRYFWGVYLNADRFKNVIIATRLFLEKAGLLK